MFVKEMKGVAQEHVFEAAANVPKGTFMRINDLDTAAEVGKTIVDEVFKQDWLKNMEEYWFQSQVLFEEQLSVASEIFDSDLLFNDDRSDAYVKLLEKTYEVYKNCEGKYGKKADIIYGARRIFETINPMDGGVLKVDKECNWQKNQKDRYIRLIDVAINFSNNAKDGYGADGKFIENLVETILSIDGINKVDEVEIYHQTNCSGKLSDAVSKNKGEILEILVNKLENNGNHEMVDGILNKVSETNKTPIEYLRISFMKQVGILPR